MLAGWLAATALMTSAALAQAPPNDNIAAAVTFTSVVPPFSNSVNTEEATTQPGEPSCFGSTATVWDAFTPTLSQPIAINTFSSTYDTTLAVYTGEPGSLEQIACNDQFGGDQSQVNFNATAGETYYVQAGAFRDTPRGTLMLTASVGPPVPEVELSIAATGSFTSRTGTAVIRGTVTCSTVDPVGPVDIFVGVRQRVGRLFIDGFDGTSVTCGGTVPFEVSITGENGRLGGGKLSVNADARACTKKDIDICGTDEVTTGVRLQGRGR